MCNSKRYFINMCTCAVCRFPFKVSPRTYDAQVDGFGPATGWVSIKFSGKDLLFRLGLERLCCFMLCFDSALLTLVFRDMPSPLGSKRDRAPLIAGPERCKPMLRGTHMMCKLSQINMRRLKLEGRPTDSQLICHHASCPGGAKLYFAYTPYYICADNQS